MRAHALKIFTIGFTRKSAREFFGKLRRPGLLRLVDVRLNNLSQLAGFSKRDDLQFFCESVLGINYIHLPQLAPTQELLDAYKKKQGDWREYELQFLSLMAERKVEERVEQDAIDGCCLLCSEPAPELCHRRLVAEYFQQKWPNVEIEHIL